MHTPARTLRQQATEAHGPAAFRPSTKEADRHERIIQAATKLMALNGPARLTLANLALALRMGRATLRWHFTDLEELLSVILTRHLRGLANAIGAVPAQDPEVAQKRRAIYYGYTHAPFGGLTHEHLLLTRDRTWLPPDLLSEIEQIRNDIGETLAGPQAPAQAYEALLLLDAPYLSLDRVETLLAQPQPAPQPQQAEPEQKPEERPELKALEEKTTLPDYILRDTPGHWIFTFPRLRARAPPPA